MEIETLLRRRDVQKATGLSRSALYAKISIGEFAPPVRIGPRAVAWKASDVQRWINERPSVREVAE